IDVEQRTALKFERHRDQVPAWRRASSLGYHDCPAEQDAKRETPWPSPTQWRSTPSGSGTACMGSTVLDSSGCRTRHRVSDTSSYLSGEYLKNEYQKNILIVHLILLFYYRKRISQSRCSSATKSANSAGIESPGCWAGGA